MPPVTFRPKRVDINSISDKILPDGTRVADVQAAIQAAWLVDPPFAAELAKRYGLYDRYCLCCADQPIAAMDPTKILREALGNLAFQLCLDCLYSEARTAQNLAFGTVRAV